MQINQRPCLKADAELWSKILFCFTNKFPGDANNLRSKAIGNSRIKNEMAW